MNNTHVIPATSSESLELTTKSSTTHHQCQEATVRKYARKIRYGLAVVLFVEFSLLMLPTGVEAAKGLPDRIPIGKF